MTTRYGDNNVPMKHNRYIINYLEQLMKKINPENKNTKQNGFKTHIQGFKQFRIETEKGRIFILAGNKTRFNPMGLIYSN